MKRHSAPKDLPNLGLNPQIVEAMGIDERCSEYDLLTEVTGFGQKDS